MNDEKVELNLMQIFDALIEDDKYGHLSQPQHNLLGVARSNASGGLHRWKVHRHSLQTTVNFTGHGGIVTRQLHLRRRGRLGHIAQSRRHLNRLVATIEIVDPMPFYEVCFLRDLPVWITN